MTVKKVAILELRLNSYSRGNKDESLSKTIAMKIYVNKKRFFREAEKWLKPKW